MVSFSQLPSRLLTGILNHFITIAASLGNMPSNFMEIKQIIIPPLLKTEEAQFNITTYSLPLRETNVFHKVTPILKLCKLKSDIVLIT